MERFNLTKSNENPGWWVLTDTINGIVIRFQQGKFNETQKVTYLGDTLGHTTQELATIMQEIGEYMVRNHDDITFTCPPAKGETNIERMRIGKIVQNRRVELGYSIRELAEMCEVSYQNITKIEHGKYNVSIDILAKMAKALGLRMTFERI